MRNLKRIFNSTMILIVSFILTIGVFTNSTYALTTKSNYVSRQFTFKNLPITTAVQNFDYVVQNGKISEIFLTQRKNRDTYLSRCTVSGSTATVRDYIKLSNYGHGESLEVVKEKGKTYIWLGSTAETSTKYGWSKNISRIEYKISCVSKTGAKIGDKKTITGIDYAYSGMYSNGKNAERSAVAIADNSDRICFRTRLKSPYSKNTYYGVYKFSEINAKLNSLKSGSVINLRDLRSSRVSYFKNVPLPNNSFQGFDITGVGANNKFMYIFGGAKGQTPTIYKYSYTNGGNYKHVETIKIKSSTANKVGALEAEGIKVEINPVTKKEEIFVSFKPNSGYTKLYTIK